MTVVQLFIREFFDRSFENTEQFFDDIYDAELAKAFEKYFPADTELSDETAQKEKSLAFRCGIKAGMRFVYEIVQIQRIKAKLKE